MHFSKIDQTYFIFYCSFINEEMREIYIKNSSKYNVVLQLSYF